jgi:hypothetical protein
LLSMLKRVMVERGRPGAAGEVPRVLPCSGHLGCLGRENPGRGEELQGKRRRPIARPSKMRLGVVMVYSRDRPGDRRRLGRLVRISRGKADACPGIVDEKQGDTGKKPAKDRMWAWPPNGRSRCASSGILLSARPA